MYTMQFDMTTPEGREAHRQALGGAACYRALTDFDEWLRQQHKYNNKPWASEARSRLHEILTDHGVSLCD